MQARPRLARIAAGALFVGWAALAAPAAGAGAPAVEASWVRASIGSSTVSAVYLTITNRGDVADRLVGVSADRSGRAMIHRTVVEDGVARMRRVGAVDVPPGASVRFEPGGLHLMLAGVSPPLLPGQEVAVTLAFERAGEVAVRVPVRRAPPPP